ncbi:MAG: hypothetical protein IH624_06085 [Phycisphaerae bacterium]|nr:hypothetical protein [Phycisphaerae bacterium]
MQIACLAALTILASTFSADSYAPTSDYAAREILGWRVLVNKQLTEEHPELAAEVLKLLENQLYQITRVVPEAALPHLKKHAFWVEYKDKNFPCMCYHPSAQWLTKNGYNPEKATGVEICGAEKFLSWTKDQPWMVLHELAHGFHHMVVGHRNRELNRAFSAAKEKGIYDSVLHINGQSRKAYAMTNVEEYFAETAEAFFGTNDFYPFVRAELKQVDPEVYALHERFWRNPPMREGEKPADPTGEEKTE